MSRTFTSHRTLRCFHNYILSSHQTQATSSQEDSTGHLHFKPSSSVRAQLCVNWAVNATGMIDTWDWPIRERTRWTLTNEWRADRCVTRGRSNKSPTAFSSDRRITDRFNGQTNIFKYSNKINNNKWTKNAFSHVRRITDRFK